MNKKIFQIYHEEKLEKCPEIIQKYANSWKENNKNFQYEYISYKDCYLFILDKYGKNVFKNVFLKLPNRAAKSDFIRYAILYERGGVYSDIDNFCQKSIYGICKNKKTLIVKQNETYLGSSFIYSHEGNELFNQILENGIYLFEKVSKDTPHFQMGVFGPYGLTRNVLSYYNMNNINEKNKEIDIINYSDIKDNIVINFSSQCLVDVDDYEHWPEEEMIIYNSEYIFNTYWKDI